MFEFEVRNVLNQSNVRGFVCLNVKYEVY